MSRITRTLLVVVIFLLILAPLELGVRAQSTNLVLGVATGPPTTFFQTPGNWGGANTITQIPYLYAYTFGSGGVAIPGVANPPTAIPGTNDTQWILNLKSPNMKWSDNIPIDSTDLEFSYGVFLPMGKYANLSSFDVWGAIRDRVSSVSIVNSTAIQLKMYNPFPLFPILAWLYQVYPYHYYKQFSGDNVLQTSSIVGGPGDTAYIPSNFAAGSRSMTLVANSLSPSWNGATPTIQTITLQFFTDESSLINALAAGTVDGSLITPSDVQALSSNSELKVDRLPSIYQMQFFIEPGSFPYSSRPFRQALMYLIPKDQVNSILYNNQSSTGNVFLLPPAAVQTYWPGPETPAYNYDPNAAVSKLKEAGFTQNSAGNWVMKNGTQVAVNLEAPNNDPDVVRAAQLIAKSMESVGLKVNLNVVDLTTATSDKYTTGNYDVILYGDEYFPSPFKWMRNPVNLPYQWHNSTFKTIFTSCLQDTNPSSALAKLKQALDILANEAVTNSVVFEPVYAAYNNVKFTGWEPALSQASSFQVFYNQVLSENLMVSVMPPAAATSTVMTTSSTSTSAPPSTDMTTYAIVGIVILIIIGAVAYFARRSKKKA